jgi:hypothetical protein
MQDMMARQGVSMNGDGIVSKVCVTREMAQRGDMPMENRKDCTVNRIPAGPSTYKWTMNCPKGSGAGEMSFQGDSAFRGSMQFKSNEADKPQDIQMEVSGKWLGADCGSIKPPGSAAKAAPK